MTGLSLSKVLKPEPGWYAGDFHAHTDSSDGHYTPPQLAAMAVERGLDFFATTEHNTIDSFTRFGEDSGVLVIPGLEITFTIGHWNVFGMESWQDWMEGICGKHLSLVLPNDRTASELLQRIASDGLLNSINHPLLKPWAWEEELTQLRYVDCLEVWNDPYWPDNEQANPRAVDFWTACLNQGYRLTAIGGSDFHFLPGDTKYPGELIGLPATYVYAEQLSGAAILGGVRRRRVYLSMGPRLTFQAHWGDGDYAIGADLGAIAGEVRFTGSVSNGSAALRLVKNGQTIAEKTGSEGLIELNIFDRLDQDMPAWYRLEAIDAAGKVIAMTNPIFTGPIPIPTLQTFGEVLESLS